MWLPLLLAATITSSATPAQVWKSDEEKGAKYAADVDKEFKETQHKEYSERVTRIGQLIAGIANQGSVRTTFGDPQNAKYAYRFKVIKDSKNPKEINAFSLPGGYIYVYEGLVAKAESDDEIAGVLAHEVAHSALRHYAAMEHKSNTFQNLSLPLLLAMIFAKGEGVQAGVAGAQLAMQAQTSVWDQDAENAADYGGFQYLLKSQYNPTGMLTFMERLATLETGGPSMDYGIYRTHPPSKERVRNILGYMATNKIQVQRSSVTTSYRVTSRPVPGGTELSFGKHPLLKLVSVDSAEVGRLNQFYDSVPELYQLSADSGKILWNNQPLLSLTQADADLNKESLDGLTKQVLRNLRVGVFDLSFHVWNVG